jgi:multiple sugar transport system substrate-binding protein
MKKSMTIVLAIILTLSVVLSACAPTTPAATTAPAAETTSGEEVAVAEGTTVTWATLAGFYTDWAKELAEEFTANTGIAVNIVEMDLPTMYEKEVLDIVGGTGAYDIITWNVSWKSEWANNDYILALDDYIARDADEVNFSDISPALEAVSGQWQGKTYGLPYYTFTPGLFYRCDLFENADEMAAFEAEYGYPLDIPQTYDQVADIAEFFHRDAGETLAGQTLDKEFFGIGLQAGRFTNIFDEVNTIAWTMGGDVINNDGTPGVDDQAYLDALNLYVNELVPNAPEGSLSGSYDYVIGQLNSGLIAMTGPMYLDQWANAVKTETTIPGSEVCAAPLPGNGKTWAGAFTLGIAKTTKNPEAAWQFLKWITGTEAQTRFAEGGGSTTRLSILEDKEFATANRETAGHFPVLASILDNASQCWYTNYIYVTQAAKIYEEAPAWLSAAASGEMSVEEAMEGFAAKITEFCDGACTIMNEGVTIPDATATECTTFSFDRSLQLRKK